MLLYINLQAIISIALALLLTTESVIPTLNRNVKIMPCLIDLTGKRFANLLVKRRSEKTNKSRTLYWVCLCDCGKEKDISGSLLRSGFSKSCGCQSANTKFQVKHNMVGTRTYKSWTSMKSRVSKLRNDGKNKAYVGMEICDRWVNSFEEFMKDMGEAPTEKHTIDRIDNSKGYLPENCRWATQAEQNRNYSLNRNITYEGKTQCVMDWAKEFGISHHRIYQRLNHGWTIEKALTTKTPKQRKSNL